MTTFVSAVRVSDTMKFFHSTCRCAIEITGNIATNAMYKSFFILLLLVCETPRWG